MKMPWKPKPAAPETQAITPAAIVKQWSTPPTAPPSDATDEGIPFVWVDGQTILNVSGDWYDQRRRELHIGGRCYSQVDQTAQGRVYRYDH